MSEDESQESTNVVQVDPVEISKASPVAALMAEISGLVSQQGELAALNQITLESQWGSDDRQAYGKVRSGFVTVEIRRKPSMEEENQYRTRYHQEMSVSLTPSGKLVVFADSEAYPDIKKIAGVKPSMFDMCQYVGNMQNLPVGLEEFLVKELTGMRDRFTSRIPVSVSAPSGASK